MHDGLIAEIGPDVPVPAGARVIDIGAYTALPGLMDAHTHLTRDERNQDPLAELEHTAAERAFGSIPNAREALLAGFTTVRDLGSYRALVDVALRDAINRMLVGQRVDVIKMFATGAVLTHDSNPAGSEATPA